MTDFSSALYLGMKHPSAALRPWDALSEGRPAVLGLPPVARRVEKSLAALLRCEEAVLAPSTLHLFWDWFGGLDPKRDIVYVDSELYPIGRWGAERARTTGVAVQLFPHHDVDDLSRHLQSTTQRRARRPVLVTDGWCPDCGRPAPLHRYLSLARRSGGLVVVDDTQALGILGANPGRHPPYGRGGGGILPWSGLGFSPEIVVIASLAKGFGVPAAVLAGSGAQLASFRARSETRLHCSPPSVAVMHATEQALALNGLHGERLRRRLAAAVRCFQQSVRQIGCRTNGGVFPMQTVVLPRGIGAEPVYHDLRKQGIRTLLRQVPKSRRRMVTFILNAGHTRGRIQRAVAALAVALRHQAAERRQNPVTS